MRLVVHAPLSLCRPLSSSSESQASPLTAMGTNKLSPSSSVNCQIHCSLLGQSILCYVLGYIVCPAQYWFAVEYFPLESLMWCILRDSVYCRSIYMSKAAKLNDCSSGVTLAAV